MFHGFVAPFQLLFLLNHSTNYLKRKQVKTDFLKEIAKKSVRDFTLYSSHLCSYHKS
ncbi:hypothetical protein RchiOBHm_Chr3g0455951 [Rosa chinensis]|uniref:Uncharacterized protein n=1 Tax=Rosa chinensis TaxID=74649 RepID=A0A2P6R770_ROSCH|nr:hypothetical protein RchiOBHm_Chr3g0455951 [Rosa chinensis]